LADEDVKEIRKFVQDADIQGQRYSSLSTTEGECIPLSEWRGEA
jgi:hypothetical protein